jgi:hypothetical protein
MQILMMNFHENSLNAINACLNIAWVFLVPDARKIGNSIKRKKNNNKQECKKSNLSHSNLIRKMRLDPNRVFVE